MKRTLTECTDAARPFLTEADRLSLLKGGEAGRTWYQGAVEGRVGPAGSRSGPLPDEDFVARLQACRGVGAEVQS